MIIKGKSPIIFSFTLNISVKNVKLKGRTKKSHSTLYHYWQETYLSRTVRAYPLFTEALPMTGNLSQSVP